MFRSFTLALVVVAAPLVAGCDMMALTGGGTSAQSTQPGVAAQGTILALQTWLLLEQSKASAAGKTARAQAAGNIMTSLGALRVESNCARRLALATAVSGGLQAEFPNYQSELSLGTNLVGILVAGVPGCA